MKKIIFGFFILFASPAFAKLNVVTTTTDLAAIARAIGQDLISVKSLAKGDEDPHTLEPKPSYVVAVSRADLLIEVGLELEVGWLPVLLTQSRNGKIQRGMPGHLDASTGLNILEISTGRIDRSMGDVHPSGNPHYWLNPENGVVIAKRIAARLALLDPEHAAHYAANAAQFEHTMAQKIAHWEKQLAPMQGKAIAYHKSFTYFADWAGIDVRGYIEPKPGIPPSPGHILSLIDLMQRESISLIMAENYYDPKASRGLAEKTGARLLILASSVNGDASITDYAGLFDYLIAHLHGAL